MKDLQLNVTKLEISNVRSSEFGKVSTIRLANFVRHPIPKNINRHDVGGNANTWYLSKALSYKAIKYKTKVYCQQLLSEALLVTLQTLLHLFLLGTSKRSSSFSRFLTSICSCYVVSVISSPISFSLVFLSFHFLLIVSFL